MNDHQKLVFIIHNESSDPEWLAEKVGWTIKRIHREYSRALENGTYPAMKAETLPEVDYDQFVERLRQCLVVDAEHTFHYWSKLLEVDQYYLQKFFTAKNPNPPSLRYVGKIAGKLKVKADWLAGRV